MGEPKNGFTVSIPVEKRGLRRHVKIPNVVMDSLPDPDKWDAAMASLGISPLLLSAEAGHA